MQQEVFLFVDNEAVIKMIIKGRNPTIYMWWMESSFVFVPHQPFHFSFINCSEAIAKRTTKFRWRKVSQQRRNRWWVWSRDAAVKTNTSKNTVSRWEMQKFGIQIEWTMTGHIRTTTSRRKEFCTWCCVCLVKCSRRMKPSCWTLRRPTQMTTWKPRSREPTRSTTWTRERACTCYSLRSQFCVVTLFSCTSHIGSRCLRVRLIPSHGHHHACMSWAFSLISLTFSSSSLSSSHSLLSSNSSWYPSTSPRLSS